MIGQRIVFASLVILGLVGRGFAAEILVPAHYDRISSAIQAANPGDTVRVTSAAAPYVESITINKNIALIADPGVDPVIRGDPDTAAFPWLIRTVAGADGATVGSEAGGRFTLDTGGIARGTSAGTNDCIRTEHTTGTTVRFDNIRIKNSPSSLAIAIRGPGNADFNLFDVDGTGGGFQAVLALSAQTEFNVTRSRFVNITSTGGGRGAAYMRGAATLNNSAKYTFSYCEMHSISSAAPSTGRECMAIYGGVNGIVNVDHCWMSQDPSAGTWMTLSIRPRDGTGEQLTAAPTISLRNCALGQFAATRGVYLVNGFTDGVTLSFDHCDFYQINNGTSAVPCILLGTRSGTADPRTISITNSLFTNNNAGAMTGVASGDNPYIVDYVSAKVVGTAWTNVTPTNEIPGGLDPGYLDPVTGDFRYTNATLLTGDQQGRPLGSAYSFANILVPPVNRAAHWSVY